MTTFEYIQWKQNKLHYKSKIFRQVNQKAETTKGQDMLAIGDEEKNTIVKSSDDMLDGDKIINEDTNIHVGKPKKTNGILACLRRKKAAQKQVQSNSPLQVTNANASQPIVEKTDTLNNNGIETMQHEK